MIYFFVRYLGPAQKGRDSGMTLGGGAQTGVSVATTPPRHVAQTLLLLHFSREGFLAYPPASRGVEVEGNPGRGVGAGRQEMTMKRRHPRLPRSLRLSFGWTVSTRRPNDTARARRTMDWILFLRPVFAGGRRDFGSGRGGSTEPGVSVLHGTGVSTRPLLYVRFRAAYNGSRPMNTLHSHHRKTSNWRRPHPPLFILRPLA